MENIWIKKEEPETARLTNNHINKKWKEIKTWYAFYELSSKRIVHHLLEEQEKFHRDLMQHINDIKEEVENLEEENKALMGAEKIRTTNKDLMDAEKIRTANKWAMGFGPEITLRNFRNRDVLWGGDDWNDYNTTTKDQIVSYFLEEQDKLKKKIEELKKIMYNKNIDNKGK